DLFVSEVHAGAVSRGEFLEWLPGRDECPVRAGEENAARTVAGLSAAVWVRGDLSYAGEFVWATGQFRSGKLARDSGADSEMLGSEAGAGGGDYGLGNGQH